MKQTLFVAFIALALCGCDDSKARVKGRIVENDQPVTFPPTQAAIEITPVTSTGHLDPTKAFTAVVNEDGTFEVLASGGELPAGEPPSKARAKNASRSSSAPMGVSTCFWNIARKRTSIPIWPRKDY